MSTNKFLQKLHQQDPTPAAPRQDVGRTAVPPSGSEDPIERLVQELSRQSRALEGLNTRIDRMEAQAQATGPPVTQADVQALLQKARQNVSFTIDSKAVAELVLPELLKRLPSTAGITAALDASVQKLTTAGVNTVERIERAAAITASRIEAISRSQADAYAGRVGFTSWKAAAVVFLGFALLIVGVYFLNSEREAALSQARSETQAVREFTNWVKSQAEGKRLYDRYHNP